jgi:hypothetical protein
LPTAIGEAERAIEQDVVEGAPPRPRTVPNQGFENL